MVVSDCLLDTCMKHKKVILTNTQISKNATSQHNTHLHSYCPPLSFSRNTVIFYSIKLESHSFLFFICSSQLMPILTPKVYFHAPCPPFYDTVASRLCRKTTCHFFPQKLLLCQYSLFQGRVPHSLLVLHAKNAPLISNLSYSLSDLKSLSRPAASHHFHYHYSKLSIFSLGLEWLLKWPLQLFSNFSQNYLFEIQI